MLEINKAWEDTSPLRNVWEDTCPLSNDCILPIPFFHHFQRNQLSFSCKRFIQASSLISKPGSGSAGCLCELLFSSTGADPGILVRGGGVKEAGRGPDQPTSESYILKSFFLQIWLFLDTLILDF